MKDRALTAPEWLARSAVYQINPRTFSAEGTLSAVAREIPALHAMGFRGAVSVPHFRGGRFGRHRLLERPPAQIPNHEPQKSLPHAGLFHHR